MGTRYLYFLVCIVFAHAIGSAQHNISIDADFDTDSKIISIQQQITYVNTSSDILTKIYFHDWANSFSGKTTPLGKRFAEDFIKKFYKAKKHELGWTHIEDITDTEKKPLDWGRENGIHDILWIESPTPIHPGEQQTFKLTYKVKIPSDKFTRYGYHGDKKFNLKYWHIVPAVYTTKWNIFSHKNLDDLYTPISNYQITLTLPQEYQLTTELQQEDLTVSEENNSKTVKLWGNKRNEVKIYLELENSFYAYPSNGIQYVSNIDDDGLQDGPKSSTINRILTFLNKRLGPYPFDKILVSENDYKSNPVYGLNQLPDIVRPFPDGFQYEIKQLKVITEKYLERTLLTNPRYDAWIKDAIHIHLIMAYTQQYYPDMKIIGKLSKVIGIRWYRLADLKFNDQYYIGYKNMMRLFLDQSLSLPQDELVKFNKNIANAYKAGVGLKYLEDYLGDDNIINESITCLLYTSDAADD